LTTHYKKDILDAIDKEEGEEEEEEEPAMEQLEF